MILSRSERGINVRRYLKGVGIQVRSLNDKRESYRPPNVIYGRARTVARLMKQDKERLTTALRCIQVSDPTALYSDVILAVFRYVGAHYHPTEPRQTTVERFRGIDLGKIRDKAVSLAKGCDGRTHAARVEGIYFLLAHEMERGGRR